MANTSGDDIALLKEELAQFLITEIASAQGGQAFRREVGDQVGAVIDKILAERLAPAIERLERQAAEQSRQTAATLDDALAKLKAAAPPQDPAATERRLSEVTAALDQLRQRVGRMEEPAKPRLGAATAQPIAQPSRGEPRLADERIAAPRATAPSLPRWALWLLLLLLALTVLGLGNLYYERLFAPAAPQPVAATTPQPAPTTPDAAPPPQQPVSVPPQNTAAIPPVTPTPAPTPPSTTPPAARVPADFAIERGWLAAQPFAVDTRLARSAGASDARPTLKSLICGRSPSCTSDALMTGTEAKQLIALQMLMSQIGDRFCSPRRAVSVTGVVTAPGLADLSAIAGCAGGAPATCRETQSKVCAPDPDALQSGSPAARAALLRWALWKTGST